MLLLDIFILELLHRCWVYRYESVFEQVWDFGRNSSRQSTAAQVSDGAMEAEVGSIRWGENSRLAGRKNVSICASEP